MNLFNLCVFGKMVEETEGAAGLIFAYLITAVGKLDTAEDIPTGLPGYLGLMLQ